MDDLFPDQKSLFGPRDFFIVLALGFLAAAGQCVLAARLGRGGFGPEPLLVLALYVALRSELWSAALAGFCLGLIRDLTGGMLVGLWSLNLVMLVWLFYPFRRRWNFFSFLTLTPLVFFLSIGGALFIMTPVMAILGWPGAQFNPLPAFFSSSIFTAVLAAPLFLLLDKLTLKSETEDE